METKINNAGEQQPIDDKGRYTFSNFHSPNKGYVGHSMSVRAKEAYESGEMPYSKWTKEDIIDNLPSEYKERLSKLSLKTLKDWFLVKSSWHHTGKFFNETDFYSIDEDIDIDLILNKIEKEKEDKKLKISTKKKFNNKSEEEKEKEFFRGYAKLQPKYRGV